jgi:hypothetical protein
MFLVLMSTDDLKTHADECLKCYGTQPKVFTGNYQVSEDLISWEGRSVRGKELWDRAITFAEAIQKLRH